MKYLNPSKGASGAVARRPGLVALGWMTGAVVGLSACAAVTPELDGYADGWRRARVEAVLAAAAAPDPVTSVHKARLHLDCRANSTASGVGVRYARVSYAYGGNPQLRRHVVAPIPEGMVLQPGQALAVQVRHCAPLRALLSGH